MKVEESKVSKILGEGYVNLLSTHNKEKCVANFARSTRNNDKIFLSEDETMRTIKGLLMRDEMNPFEHAVLTFNAKCPLYIRSQWFRYRTGAYTEISRRYCPVETIDDFCVLDEVFNLPRIADADLSKKCIDVYNGTVTACLHTYKYLRESGMPIEQARGILPQCLWTKFTWTVNLRNLLHFLDQRLDRHAQKEMRCYAAAVCRLSLDKYPITINWFLENNDRQAEVYFEEINNE